VCINAHPLIPGQVDLGAISVDAKSAIVRTTLYAVFTGTTASTAKTAYEQ